MPRASKEEVGRRAPNESDTFLPHSLPIFSFSQPLTSSCSNYSHMFHHWYETCQFVFNSVLDLSLETILYRNPSQHQLTHRCPYWAIWRIYSAIVSILGQIRSPLSPSQNGQRDSPFPLMIWPECAICPPLMDGDRWTYSHSKRCRNRRLSLIGQLVNLFHLIRFLDPLHPFGGGGGAIVAQTWSSALLTASRLFVLNHRAH